MLDALLQLDGGILLWIQTCVRSAVLTPVFTLYTHLGDAGMLWIVLSVVMLFFRKTR